MGVDSKQVNRLYRMRQAVLDLRSDCDPETRTETKANKDRHQAFGEVIDMIDGYISEAEVEECSAPHT